MMALLNGFPMAVFTSLFNVTGLPAISVPVHHDEATGLPVGVQIVAAPWQEDLLLQVARTLELALPWADRRPPVDLRAGERHREAAPSGSRRRRHVGGDDSTQNSLPSGSASTTQVSSP